MHELATHASWAGTTGGAPEEGAFVDATPGGDAQEDVGGVEVPVNDVAGLDVLHAPGHVHQAPHTLALHTRPRFSTAGTITVELQER